MKTKIISVQGGDPRCPGAEMGIPWSWAWVLLCSCQRPHSLVLGNLAGADSWIVVPAACQDFCADRNGAGRREMTVGRRMVFCGGGKKDGMSLEFGEGKYTFEVQIDMIPIAFFFFT